ncbi:import inner membrane translocase subunit tim22 [Anaeramoeba ignava]|uniref:Import inner membrane translocase subunit tim22 n=1 Tax=Anaeramoeba ignava TaxID=1746090 RepID=A0A9Q0RE17_ANAIG|nr:import inner membrane translocase subunit tim22 [Anaeramoeba ignava]
MNYSTKIKKKPLLFKKPNQQQYQYIPKETFQFRLDKLFTNVGWSFVIGSGIGFVYGGTKAMQLGNEFGTKIFLHSFVDQFAKYQEIFSIKFASFTGLFYIFTGIIRNYRKVNDMTNFILAGTTTGFVKNLGSGKKHLFYGSLTGAIAGFGVSLFYKNRYSSLPFFEKKVDQK